MRGHLEFENKNPLPGVHLPNSDLHGNLNLPDTISFGVMWKPMETLSFEAGTVYTVWSNYRSLNIHVDRLRHRIQPQKLARHVGLQRQCRIQGARLADPARRLCFRNQPDEG